MKNIPNILSLGRIVLIPFFAIEFLKGNTTSAAIILIISGLTDFVDGFLARKFGWITSLGKVLDPTADKLTLIAVCIVLAIALKEYRIFFGILLLKDLIMVVLGGYLIKKDVKINGAKWFGKIATALFYVSMIIIALFPSIANNYIKILLTIVTVVEVISALLYIPDYISYLKSQSKQN